MKQTDIDRINELYHLSQVRELTDAEKQEQHQECRKGYGKRREYRRHHLGGPD